MSDTAMTCTKMQLGVYITRIKNTGVKSTQEAGT